DGRPSAGGSGGRRGAMAFSAAGASVAQRGLESGCPRRRGTAAPWAPGSGRIGAPVRAWHSAAPSKSTGHPTRPGLGARVQAPTGWPPWPAWAGSGVVGGLGGGIVAQGWVSPSAPEAPLTRLALLAPFAMSVTQRQGLATWLSRSYGLSGLLAHVC